MLVILALSRSPTENLYFIVTTAISNVSDEGLSKEDEWISDFRFYNEGVIQGLVGLVGLIGEFPFWLALATLVIVIKT